jgi:hypothetical protein
VIIINIPFLVVFDEITYDNNMAAVFRILKLEEPLEDFDILVVRCPNSYKKQKNIKI